MNKGSRIVLAAALMSATIAGCGGGEETSSVTTVVDTNQVVEPTEPKVFYQIPTPNEFFSVIKEIGGKSRPELMNPVANTEKYTETRFKALNFGIYSADIAYASCYEIGQSALEYFKAVEKMGNELDISSAFDESVFKRIEQNLTEGDSLVSISNETYFDAYNYLEENDRGNILALVVAGGWVESIYVVSNLAGPYKDKNPLIERMAQQGHTLTNVIEFMRKYIDDPAVGMTIAQLEEIQMIYETLEVVEKEITTENTGDKLNFSGNAEFKFSKETYEDLTNKVKELRTKYVEAKN
ncbi:MAG: hypothetical protein ACK40M_09840 [Flavobacteriales bacterium]